VNAIRSFRSLPVLIDGNRIILRAGRLKRVEIAPLNVAGLRGRWDAAALKEPGVFNAALIAYPNVVVDLRAPVSVGRRSVRSIAHRLDDPAAFARAIEALGAGHE
jgi:hypothetical protein